MLEAGAHACTDITGFGLLGHACGMIENSTVGIEINVAAIPVFPEVRGFAEMGLVPGGTHRNKEFRFNMIEQSSVLGDDIWNILFDPQTSGGLLISIASADADALLENLHRHGIEDAAIIGEVIEEPRGRIAIRE
jgi:selenide,water dikinase